jgi:hypothetical protein
MAIPVKFIAKRTIRRLQKGKSVSPFLKTKKTPALPPVSPPTPQRSNAPIFIIGGILLALLLKK